MIELKECQYLAKGTERKCYIHPDDAGKVIKTEFILHKDREQNKIDQIYYAYLLKKNISLKHIAKFFGTVNTNYGLGVVFERIENHDGTASETFENILNKQTLSRKTTDALLEELRQYLKTNYIVLGDVYFSNILCQKISTDRYKLIIIDGIGARRMGWKLRLHMYSRIYTNIRIKKQWKKLLSHYRQY